MTNKEETRARLEALKGDQETLRKELASLNTFMEKKARGGKSHRHESTHREPPRRDSDRDYDRRNSKDYDRRDDRDRRDRYEEPAPRYQSHDAELYDMVQQNLDETKKMMDKFDYLLDTLIQSMEEVEGENVDDLIKVLAESQMHVMDVLASVKVGLDQAKANAATKKEIDEMHSDHAAHYQDLNKKMNVVMEQIQAPPYLTQLDSIRVSVSNMESEIRRLEQDGIKAGGGIAPELEAAVEKMKTQTESLQERLVNLSSSIENINDHLNHVQATTSGLADMKNEMQKMQNILTAKNDQVLNETQLKIGKLEEHMVDLGDALSKIKKFEGDVENIPNDQVEHLLQELKSIKATPNGDVTQLHSKIDALQDSLTKELKKKSDEDENHEILLRLLNKASQFEENLEHLQEEVRSGEAASAYSDLALENRLEGLIDQVMQHGDVEELKRQLDEVQIKISNSNSASAYDNSTLQKKLSEIENTFKQKNEDLDHELIDIHEQLHKGQVGDSKAKQALENKIDALAKLVAVTDHYDEIKQLEQELTKASDELNSLRRKVKSVEVVETYSRLRDKDEAINKTKELEHQLNLARKELTAKAEAIEEALHKSDKTGSVKDRKAMEMLESLRDDLTETKQYAQSLENSLKEDEEEIAELGENKELKNLLEEQKQKLAKVEANFDVRTNTLEREFLNTKAFLESRRKEREERIGAQLQQLKNEVNQARTESEEILPDLDKRVNKIFSEMEKLKVETPDELKALASQINKVSHEMDGMQKELRYGETREEKIVKLSEEVGRLYSMISALTEEAGKNRMMFTKIETLEKALDKAKSMDGNELESALGVIKNELVGLEKEVEDVRETGTGLSQEINSVHTDIAQLEKKTRDEIHARLNDLKEHAASTEDITELKHALETMDKRLEKEHEMEALRERISLAKIAVDKGEHEEAKTIVKTIPIPKHVVTKKLSAEGLTNLENDLKEADEDYTEFIEKVRALKQEYEDNGLSKELKEELMYLEEDLLDFWIDKRGLVEALEQARKGNFEAAKQIMEYEKAVLEDLKLDMNNLRMHAAKLPKKAVAAAESAMKRRETVETELSSFDELQDSLNEMKKEREKLQKELQAAKNKSVKAIIPEKIQDSLLVAKNRASPAVSREIVQLESDLENKKLVPISSENLNKANKKIGELAGRARQIEYGTGDKRATVVRERLEKSRSALKAMDEDSQSIKKMAILEELQRVKNGNVLVSDLSARTGVSVDEVKQILGGMRLYTVSGEHVTKT